MTKQLRIKLKFIIVLILSVTLLSQPVYGWGPITHYHINRESGFGSGISYPFVFYQNGTGPDMFLFMKPAANQAHSPLPFTDKEGHDWRNDPNFAYIMLKVRGKDTPVSRYYASAMGWGGHIAGDWVAHGSVYSIVEYWLDDPIGYVLHPRGEALYDYYMFLTRGPIAVSPFYFYPEQIRKTFVNYELVRRHRDTPEKADAVLKSEALKAAPPVSFIYYRSAMLASATFLIQAAFAARMAQSNPTEIALFIDQMNALGAEANIWLSTETVRDWMANPSTYDSIPTGLDQTAKQLGSPLSTTGGGTLSAQGFIQPAMAPGSEDSSLVGAALQSTDQPGNSDYILYSFWEDVAERAEQTGILQVEETQSVDPNGEEVYTITPTITNQEQFWNILEQTIYDHINNPTSDLDRNFAVFQKNLFIRGILDVDKLMDVTPPTITNQTPPNGSYTPWHKPLISAQVSDNPGGIGVDEESIILKVDGKTVPHSYNPLTGTVSYVPTSYLETGTHTASLEAKDLADNRTSLSWSFTVKTLFESASFSKEDTEIRGNVKVKGDVSAGGKVLFSGKSYQILGLIKEAQDKSLFPEVDFGYYKFLSQANPNIIYSEEDIRISGKEAINKTIVSEKNIYILGNTNLTTALDNLALIARGDIIMEGTSRIEGAIYSENGQIRLSGNTSVFGSLAGRKIFLNGNPSLEYNPALGR